MTVFFSPLVKPKSLSGAFARRFYGGLLYPGMAKFIRHSMTWRTDHNLLYVVKVSVKFLKNQYMQY